MMAKVSFIIPVYRVKEDQLNKCITSVLNQTVSDWEIILVDDGAPNSISAILDMWAANSSRIKVIHQDNQGVCVARNNGLELSQGEYILYLDADDWIEFDYIDRLKDLLCEYKPDVLAYGHADELDNETLVHLENTDNIHLFSPKEKMNIYRCLLGEEDMYEKYGMFFGAQWKMLFRREMIIENDIRNIPGIVKSEDALFCMHAVEASQKIMYCREVLYHYNRKNENSDQETQRPCSDVYMYNVLLESMSRFVAKQPNSYELRSALTLFTIIRFTNICNDVIFQMRDKNEAKRYFNEVIHSKAYKEIINMNAYRGQTLLKKMQLFFMKTSCMAGMRTMCNIQRIYRLNTI